MAKISTNDCRQGMKIELEGQPYTIVSNDFVKPGKGRAFNRMKIKHLITGRVLEKTITSGGTIEIADVLETSMRMLYRDPDGVVFMDDTSYEQTTVLNTALEDVEKWLLEETIYNITFYKDSPVSVTPPTFMDLKVVETAPGVRGDTASGRVLKPSVLESGAKVQIPIFIEEEEIIKVDTRTGEYVARAAK